MTLKWFNPKKPASHSRIVNISWYAGPPLKSNLKRHISSNFSRFNSIAKFFLIFHVRYSQSEKIHISSAVKLIIMKIKQANKYYIKKREFKLLTNCFLTFNILEKKKIMELNFQMVFLEWNLECCVREKVLVWLWELVKFVKIPFFPFWCRLGWRQNCLFHNSGSSDQF